MEEKNEKEKKHINDGTPTPGITRSDIIPADFLLKRGVEGILKFIEKK